MGSRYGMATSDGHLWTGTTLAIAGKYNIPLGDSFEVYPRLGLQRTGISDDNYDAEMSGTGFLVGGGAEFIIPTKAVGLSVYVDYSVIHTSMTTWNAMDQGLTSRIWTLGATLAF
jgi:hypothetical protein